MEDMFDTLGSMRGAAYAIKENGLYRGVFIENSAQWSDASRRAVHEPGARLQFRGYGCSEYGGLLSMRVRIDKIGAGFYVFVEDKDS